jgi:hypothetical protein
MLPVQLMQVLPWRLEASEKVLVHFACFCFLVWININLGEGSKLQSYSLHHLHAF